MNEIALVVAAFLGATAVIFGAFGAHLLKKKLTTDQLQSLKQESNTKCIMPLSS